MIYKLLIFSFFLNAFGQLAQSTQLKTITLTNDNFVSLRGPVTSTSISVLINELIEKKADTLYIHLSTNGGSVDAGMKLVNLIHSLQDNNIVVNCIADKAISMGFVIFQTCSNRYVTRHATLMQHQMSLSTDGKIRDLNSYVKYVNSIEDEINENQANRIGLSFEEFNEKIRDDWWLTAKQSISNKVADEIVNIKCTNDNKEFTVSLMSIFGKLDMTYMKCPLVVFPIKVLLNEKNLTNDINKNILDEINSHIGINKFQMYNQYNFNDSNFNDSNFNDSNSIIQFNNDLRMLDLLIEINHNLFGVN